MAREAWARRSLVVAACVLFFSAGALGASLAELLEVGCAPGAPAAFYATPEVCRMETAVARLTWDGGELELEVLVADEPLERYAGYQLVGREFVAASAMLFVFESPQAGAFHMCNVLAPLEIAWFRPDGSLLDARLMTPGPVASPAVCPALFSPRTFGRYQFALELPGGFFERIGIGPDAVGTLRLAVEEWTGAP